MEKYKTDGFMFFSSYYEAIRPISEHDRLLLLDAILDYVFEGKEPDDLPALLYGYFALLRPNLDSSIKKRAASVSNGRRGGRPSKSRREKASKNPTETQEKPSQKAERIGKEGRGGGQDVGENMAGEPPRASRFTPPSVQDVRAYCLECGVDVDAEQFVDFYASKGWRVGKGPMEDWRAAVRTWARRDKSGGGHTNEYTRKDLAASSDPLKGFHTED